jgi:hypothetical protein
MIEAQLIRLLYMGFSLFLLHGNLYAHVFKNKQVKADSNAKIILLQDPGNGLIRIRAELFWTFNPEQGDGAPSEILLFFQVPPEGEQEESPTLTHCYLDHRAVPDPPWIPGKGFLIPLSSPLFPGTRIHLEFLFSYTIKQPVPHGILHQFYPKIPMWKEGRWIVPPEFQAVFPAGTSHVLMQNSQTRIVIPGMFLRMAAENRPELMNGCSIAINSEILQTAQWGDTALLLSPSWNKTQVYQCIERVQNIAGQSLPSQWIILKGKNQTGWGICSAHSPEELNEVLFQSLMAMNYPVLQPENENIYHDLWIYLSRPERTAWNEMLRRCFLPVPDHKDLSPLSCYLKHSPQKKIMRQIHQWLNSGAGQLTSLEKIFDLESPYSNAHISISNVKSDQHSWT